MIIWFLLCKGSYKERDNNSDYATTGYFLSGFNDASVNSDTYIDDLTVYALPSELKYNVGNPQNAETDKLTLYFNMIPDKETLKAENFTVKNGSGVSAEISSVEYDESNPRKLILKFAKNLEPNSDYTVAAKSISAGSGAASTTTGNGERVVMGITFSDVADKAFKTGKASEMEYLFKNCEKYQDYSNLAVKDTISNRLDIDADALYGDETAYSIKEESGNKFLRVTKNTTTSNYAIWKTSATVSANSGYFAAEYRVRPNFGDKKLIFDSRNEAYYGLETAYLFSGKIYATATDVNNDNALATYKDNEWVTLGVVYRDADFINGTATRDIYVNGKLTISLRLRNFYDPDNASNAGGYIDVDYIRMYTPNSNFAANLPSASETSVKGLNV